MIIKGGNYRGGNFLDYIPPPVTAGIKLFLDAGNPESYSGSGTTWTDLSGENNNASIQSGMTYSASNDGVFNFDGGGAAYAQINPGFGYDYGAGVTVNVWAKFTSPVDPEVDGNWERLIDFGNGTPLNNIIWCRDGTSNNMIMDIEGINSSEIAPNPATITWDGWAMYTMLADGTYWKMYKNGVFQGYESNTGVPATVTRDYNYIGKSNWPADSYFKGSMSVVQLYAYALNENQITQNYDAFRRRYGL